MRGDGLPISPEDLCLHPEGTARGAAGGTTCAPCADRVRSQAPRRASCARRGATSPRDPDNWQAGYSAVRATVAAPGDLDAVRQRIVEGGGEVGVIVPPSSYPGEAVFLGWVTPKAGSALLGQRGITQVLTPGSRFTPAITADLETSPGLSFWHQVVSGEWTEPAAVVEPRQHDTDVRVPADLPFGGGDAPSRGGEGLPSINGTSDQMTGTVTTALFLCESNGTLDANLYSWTPADSAAEVSGVIGAMSWWSGKAPTYGQSVTFTVLIYGPSSSVSSTKYEPVIHRSNEVSLWVSEILSHLGYSSGSDITRARNFDNSLIATYHTNWAFCIFNGYNPLPASDAYSDGTSAWAYLNGPYEQTLFRSYSWLPQQVTAHETGHIFGACDEYAGACGCDVCNKNTLNANCESCNPATIDCMMKANSYRLCAYTPGQIGWQTAVATVVIDTMVVSDPAPANNDGGADAGETAYLSITLANIGTAPARAVTGTLSTTDPYVTVLTSTSSFGDVILTATGATQFKVSISPSAPEGHAALLKLVLAGSSGFAATDTDTLIISPTKILRVTPSTVANTGPVLLRLGGHHFLSGSTLRIENSVYGTITATGVTRVNADSLTGTVNVTGQPLSHWDLVVLSPNGQRAGLASALYITPAGPGITSASPNVGSSTDSVTFILKGVNFNSPLGVWLEQGATKRYASGITVVTPESLRCGMSFKGLAAGVYDVVEQNFDTQTARLVGGVTLYGPPDLQALAPEVVGNGGTAVLTFSGANFASGGTAYLTARNKAPIYASVLQYDSSTQIRATFTLPGNVSGTRTVTLTNPGGARDSLVGALSIVPPPTAHVVHPNGGEILAPGTSTTIGWTAQSFGNGLDHVLVELSLDGGLTFGTLIASAAPEDTSVTWLVPSTVTDSARVRVIAYDVDNISGADDSDANFTIGTATGIPGERVPARWQLVRTGGQPAHGAAAWRLDVADRAPVVAAVYDVRGALVARLVDATLVPGSYALRWDGRTLAGRAAGTGVYVCRVDGGTRHLSTRVVLAR